MARRRIVVEEEAKAELRHAYEWYAAKNSAVAQDFEEEFVRAIDIIAEEAETFPFHDGEARRALLSSYPYAVIFEVIGDDVFVVAVMHLKRKPGYWKK